MKQRHAERNNRAISALYKFVLFVMVFTGFGQMPLYKRYYISDIPGLAWTSDFYVTHTIHYVGAMFLLGFFAYMIVDYFFLGKKEFKLTYSAWIRIVLMGGIVVTGIFRVFKNMPDVVFSPGFTFFIDLSHIGFMMFYLFTALTFLIMKSGWVIRKAQ